MYGCRWMETLGSIESPHEFKRPPGFQIPVISLTDTSSRLDSNTTDDKKLHDIKLETNNNNVGKITHMDSYDTEAPTDSGVDDKSYLSDSAGGDNSSDVEKVKSLCSKTTTSGASLSERIQNLSFCISWIKAELVSSIYYSYFDALQI